MHNNVKTVLISEYEHPDVRITAKNINQTEKEKHANNLMTCILTFILLWFTALHQIYSRITVYMHNHGNSVNDLFLLLERLSARQIHDSATTICIFRPLKKI